MPGKILKSAAHAGIKNAQESLRVSLSQSMVIFPLHVPFTPWSPATRSVYSYRPGARASGMVSQTRFPGAISTVSRLVPTDMVFAGPVFPASPAKTGSPHSGWSGFRHGFLPPTAKCLRSACADARCTARTPALLPRDGIEDRRTRCRSPERSHGSPCAILYERSLLHPPNCHGPLYRPDKVKVLPML